MKKIWILIIVAAILMSLLFIAKPMITGQSISEQKEKIDTFAKCITNSGAVMYGTDWCGFCQKQKKEFGRSFKEINYVNCDYNKDECLVNGVSGYPTWKINDETYSGFQSFRTLSRLTGCEI
jgi:hypothetical protein